MAHEIITIDVGGAGINLGSTIWEQYNLEHNIDNDGKRSKKKDEFDDQQFRSFYEETSTDNYKPRSLIIDSECDSVNNIKASQHKMLFDPKFMLSHKANESTGNFASGYHVVGKDMEDKIMDALGKLVEKCDKVQGFMINHSVGGGTGSGLTALLLERLTVDYRKKINMDFEIFSNQDSRNTMQVYNELFSLHWTLDHTNISMVFDNRQLQNICRDRLLIEAPTYYNINGLIARFISSMTCGLRFELELVSDMKDFVVYLVPFPRLHHLISSMAPIIPSDENKQGVTKRRKLLVDGYVRTNRILQKELLYKDIMHLLYSIYNINVDIAEDRWALNPLKDLSEDAFDPKYFSIECNDFDAEEDKYMAVTLMYRGKATSMKMNATAQDLKTNRKCTFVEWCPTGFRIQHHDMVAPILPRDAGKMKSVKTDAVMMGNNTCVSRYFTERIREMYDEVYPQRTDVNHYIDAGMEEKMFKSAREDIAFLEKDYLDVLAEMSTDEDEESS